MTSRCLVALFFVCACVEEKGVPRDAGSPDAADGTDGGDRPGPDAAVDGSVGLSVPCWATETGCDPTCEFSDQRVLEHYPEACTPTCNPAATYYQPVGTCSSDGSGRCFSASGAVTSERLCATKLMYPYGDSTCTNPGDWCVEGADYTRGTDCATYDVVSSVKECYWRDSEPQKTIDVLLVLYDPVLGSGRPLHEEYGWSDPRELVSELVFIFHEATGGFVDYHVADEVLRDHDDPGYAALWSDLRICDAVATGGIDEVWVYASPQMGFQGGAEGLDEFAYKIPGDALPYGVPTNYWMYEGRKKDIPDCNGKTVFVMGWNFERGIAEALESYAHRVESTLGVTISRGDWQADCGATTGMASDFDKFTCLAMGLPGSPLAVAGCGNAHSAFNGDGGYDRDTTDVVATACESYSEYQFDSPSTVNENCDAWGCTADGYLRWWLRHLPRQDGVSARSDVQNWWEYLIDFDEAVARAKSGG